jgi:hypothetical protein
MQGDPLTLLLFVPMTDVLVALLNTVDEKGLFEPLTNFGVKYRISLFTDNVALVIRPVEREIEVPKRSSSCLTTPRGFV